MLCVVKVRKCQLAVTLQVTAKTVVLWIEPEAETMPSPLGEGQVVTTRSQDNQGEVNTRRGCFAKSHAKQV